MRDLKSSSAELVLVDVDDVQERLGGQEEQLLERCRVEAGRRTPSCRRREPRAPSRPPPAWAPRLLSVRASFCSRGIALSRVWRSARISSVLIVSMSSSGETRPSTWTTSSSVKARSTWQMASDSRMLARNLLPRPAPSLAPLTMPAMSTNCDGGRQDPLGAEDAGQHLEPRVGHADDAGVRLDGRERVVRRQDVVLRERVEQGGLADVGQSDDADGECHDFRSFGRVCRGLAAYCRGCGGFGHRRQG